MGHMGQVGHFKMTHLYHPPFQMEHASRGTLLDAYNQSGDGVHLDAVDRE